VVTLVWGFAFDKSFIATLAELSTPGKPAPGCVPAPTRKRFLMPSA